LILIYEIGSTVVIPNKESSVVTPLEGNMIHLCDRISGSSIIDECKYSDIFGSYWEAWIAGALSSGS
jgi:hypothetical protein